MPHATYNSERQDWSLLEDVIDVELIRRAEPALERREPVEIEMPQGQTVRLPDGYRVDVDRVIGEIRVAFGHDAVRL